MKEKSILRFYNPILPHPYVRYSPVYEIMYISLGHPGHWEQMQSNKQSTCGKGEGHARGEGERLPSKVCFKFQDCE